MVYENVLCGSFIYSLGVVAGKRAFPNDIVKDSVNLFQQTPQDQKIGDIMAAWGGKLFIVEFKRSLNHLPSEIKKKTREDWQKKLIENGLAKTSEKCHYIAYADYDPGNQERMEETKVTLLFRKYHEALFAPKKHAGISMSQFIAKILDDDAYGITSKEEFKKYLQTLSGFPFNDDPSDKSSISGLVVCVSAQNEPIVIQYSSYGHLMQLMGMDINLKEYISLKQYISEQNALDIDQKQQNKLRPPKL